MKLPRVVVHDARKKYMVLLDSFDDDSASLVDTQSQSTVLCQ